MIIQNYIRGNLFLGIYACFHVKNHSFLVGRGKFAIVYIQWLQNITFSLPKTCVCVCLIHKGRCLRVKDSLLVPLTLHPTVILVLSDCCQDYYLVSSEMYICIQFIGEREDCIIVLIIGIFFSAPFLSCLFYHCSSKFPHVLVFH